VYDRGNCEVPGEKEYTREKNDGEILTWERGERKKGRKEGAGSAMRRERQSSTCGMDAAK
jgi:hypothetical protein